MRHGGQRAPPAQSPMPTGLKLKLVYRNTFRKLIFLLLCGCLLFAAELTAKALIPDDMSLETYIYPPSGSACKAQQTAVRGPGRRKGEGPISLR